MFSCFPVKGFQAGFEGIVVVAKAREERETDVSVGVWTSQWAQTRKCLHSQLMVGLSKWR